MADIDVLKYLHSPVHKALVLKDHAGLKEILAGVPRLMNPFDIHTEAESIAEEEKATALSAIVDRRDVPNRDTPLHLAAKLGDEVATEMLMAAGANKNLKNKQGWSALSEAILNKQEKIGLIMVRYSIRHLERVWRRRLPRYIATMQRMKDSYMEITFHFESSVIPFISRIAPSDTYRIWKRGGNLRADMTLAGFDGLKIKRSDQSIIFFGDGLEEKNQPPGSMVMVSHKHKKVYTSSFPSPEPTEREIQQKFNIKAGKERKEIVTGGIDMTQAFLVPQLTWRRKERKEMVGPWKSKVYDMNNVNISVRSKRIPGAKTDDRLPSNEKQKKSKEFEEILTEEERKQLEVALAQDVDPMESNNGDEFDHKKSEKKDKKGRQKEKDKKGKHANASSSDSDSVYVEGESGESEYKRGMKPTLWLSSDFPQKIEELLPMLDILADKVKAVRRLRELLTTKLPKDTFPVKVAIPVIPTVKVLISFTKFEELPPLEEFSSAPSSPTSADLEDSAEYPSSSWFQWTKSNPGSSSADSSSEDPFAIPSDYTWCSYDAKSKQHKNKTEKS